MEKKTDNNGTNQWRDPDSRRNRSNPVKVGRNKKSIIGDRG